MSTPDDELFESITKVAATFTNTPVSPPFLFSFSDSSVTHNTELMEAINSDLTKIINEKQDTYFCYGSEFWSIEDLSSIYRRHKLFLFFTEIHYQGMKYNLYCELTENMKVEELSANLDRGNHHLVISSLKGLKAKVNKEVNY